MNQESKKRCFAAALIFFALTIPRELTADSRLAWMGVGTVSCAKFEDLYKKDPTRWEFVFFSWTQGFLSGLNTPLLGSGTAANLNLANFDHNEQKGHVRHFCDQHPLKSYVEAVLDLNETIRAKQRLTNWHAAIRELGSD